MDPSQLRKQIHEFDKQRRSLLGGLMRTRGALVAGSLYQIWRRCGNPNCKCARGQKHASWYLSRAVQGRTRLSYVGRVAPRWLEQCVERYQQYQRLLAAVRKLDGQISQCLNDLRACYAQTPEAVLKKEK